MSTKTADHADIDVFKSQLKRYKELLDADIAAYGKELQKNTLQHYGAQARLTTDAFLEILGRGGKRIRGALTMLGYEMTGGKDMEMIVQAARAIEMMHAYILMIDDIQDRSITRRGGRAAHVILADHHRNERWADDSAHFGVALALNAANSGCHAANMILANLPGVDAELRMKAVSILNRTMIVTSHGQTYDIINEVIDAVDEKQVDQVLEWKTAHYTFLNPLQIGMVLSGSDCDITGAVTDYSMHAGRAFQITDDILGTFGTEFESGKSPMDDIKEGKRTLLTVYALTHADNGNKNFLIQMLGNHKLTPAEFTRCKDILADCGALDHAKDEARRHVELAITALDKRCAGWDPKGLQFMRGLAQYLLMRNS